jgi:pimeloyl-ACP methyl ester carboxylesterase
MARAISTEAEAAGAAVWLLRYRHRGWNGGAGPVADARWALDRVRAELGALPVVLLGHSMGARTSVHVADDPQVRGVVALAPWFPGGEPVAPLAGRRLVAAHGSRDRITSARATRAYVERARHAGADASFVDMGQVGHYLLRRVGAWNHLALSRSLELLGTGSS